MQSARGCSWRSHHHQLLPNSQGVTRWNLHPQIIPKPDWRTILPLTEEGTIPESITAAVSLREQLVLHEEEDDDLATSMGVLVARAQKWKEARHQQKMVIGGLAGSGIALVAVAIMASWIYRHISHRRSQAEMDSRPTPPLVIYGLPPSTAAAPPGRTSTSAPETNANNTSEG